MAKEQNNQQSEQQTQQPQQPTSNPTRPTFQGTQIRGDVRGERKQNTFLVRPHACTDEVTR
jgi:hypothetical protein